MGVIYMELNDAGITRFWSIEWEDKNVLVFYGRVGTRGTCLQKSFEDADDALQYVTQNVVCKQELGYVKKRNNINGNVQHAPNVDYGKRAVSGIVKRKASNNENVGPKRLEIRNSKKVTSCKGYDAPNTDAPLGKVDECVKLPIDRFEIYQKEGELYDILLKTESTYYIMQILVDTETDVNIKLYTRWGSVGSSGRCQLISCGDIAHAKDLFASKFWDRTGREWNQRKQYTPVRGMYEWIQSMHTNMNIEKGTTLSSSPPSEEV
eukprot:TRINITY_DN1059_c1_g1_i2.p1 TRINITY_DN1059_c1_g1~~TRINITY_DN1059_c1_g1_i2.p1  ORF type:complete len:264 (+),score=19.39 TRINITY_DN1059_c1_g1_i2:171-962(+)